VKSTVIILFICFGFGVWFSGHSSTKENSVHALSDVKPPNAKRRPAFAYVAPTTPIEDFGAEEEDEDELISSDTCKAPGNCILSGKPQKPLEGSEKLIERVNPIEMAFTGYSNSDAVNDLIRVARQQIEENPARYIVKS